MPGDFASFELLLPATNAVPASPRFTFGTFGAELASWYYDHRHLHAGGLFRAAGIEIVGPYALVRDQEVYCCPEANLHPAHVNEVINRLREARRSLLRRTLRGQYTMFTGPGYKIYGHWLSDFLPKLSILNGLGYALNEIKVIIPSDTPKFGRDWLSLVGIRKENTVEFDPETESVSVEELWVPTTLHNGVRGSELYCEASRIILETLGPQMEELPQTPRHLFISRALAPQTRALANRQEIEAIAVRAGLEVVHPQSLSLLQQVALFQGAQTIVGEYGSALHNSLFSSPGTVVCALRGSDRHPAFIQSGLGYALSQPTGYVFGDSDPIDGRFRIRGDDLTKCLNTLLMANKFE